MTDKAIGIAVIVLLIGGIIAGFMFGIPTYNVWSAGMEGRATLSHADYERQVQVVNAQANLQAQNYNAQSEVIRAKGVAAANNIVKDSITDQYIRYLWVQTLENNKGNQIIYVPTEMGLPLSEAGRAVQPSK